MEQKTPAASAKNFPQALIIEAIGLQVEVVECDAGDAGSECL